MFAHGETVTVERRATTDKWGDITPGDEFQLHGVAFAPRYSTEDNSNSNTVVTGLTMYAPYDTSLLPTDVIRRSGTPSRRYQVVGEPGQWRNPFTGWQAGTEVALERVTG